MIDPVGSVLKGYFENGRIIEEDSKSYLVKGFEKIIFQGVLILN